MRLSPLPKRDSQTRIDAAYAEFGKMGTVLEVDAFLKTVKERFGQQEKDLDKSLWRMQDGKAVYVNDIGDRSEAVAARTYDYARYMTRRPFRRLCVPPPLIGMPYRVPPMRMS